MRKGKAPKRSVTPDMRYNSIAVAKFINYIMQCGQKEIARRTFYEALDIISAKTEKDGFEIWQEAIAQVSPSVEVRSYRMRGTNVQVPSPVRPARRQFLGMKWIVRYARKRSGKSMKARLAAEVMAAAQGEGAAFKRKTDIHKMAESNKAFSHLRK